MTEGSVRLQPDRALREAAAAHGRRAARPAVQGQAGCASASAPTRDGAPDRTLPANPRRRCA